MNKELEKLFDDWHKSNCWRMDSSYKSKEKEVFVTDGFIKYDKYKESNKKILFISKEAHLGNEENRDKVGDGTRINLIDDVRENGEIITPRIFWTRLAEWSYALLNTTDDRLASIGDVECMEGLYSKLTGDKELNRVNLNKSDALSRVAVINLKKAAGDTTTEQDKYSNFLDSLKDKETYINYLKNEINIINPEIIVCCGTFEIFRNGIIKDKSKLIQEKNRLYRLNSNENKSCIAVIDYLHPSARVNSDLAFYGIASIIQSSYKERKQYI